MTDTIARSVTRADYTNGSGTIPDVWYINVASPFGNLHALPDEYSRRTDMLLSHTPRLEAMWAAATYKSTTKFAARGFTIHDTGKRRAARYQELFLTSQYGLGWIPFVEMLLQDFLLTDNGCFIEVIRATKSRGSRIIGLAHLDSLRCTRTGNPDRPVIYEDRAGNFHELRDYQVIAMSDMPSPRATLNGVGFCAAHRAYPTIRKMSAMETYVFEKIAGNNITEIELVSGVQERQLADAVKLQAYQQAQKGFVQYRGKLIIPGFDPSNPPQGHTIRISEIPDGFEAEEERRNAYLIYANAIGVAVQDIQPLSGQGLGTGTQTIILDEAQEGMGLAAFAKNMEHAFNERILPDTTSFMFSINDLRDQKQRAEVSDLRADTRTKQIASGEITSQEARQLAVEAGDLPDSFIEDEQDIAGEAVTDEDKQELEETDETAPPLEDTEKAKKKRITNVGKELDRVMERAKELYEEVS